MNLATYLKTNREKAKLTQEQVAKTLGYKNSQFCSNWERSISAPPAEIVNKLSELLQVDPCEMVEVIADTIAIKAKESFVNKWRAV